MMAPPASKPNFTFINLTDNPVDGRDERRIFVRRTVMTEYHKRKKQQTTPRNTSPIRVTAQTQSTEPGSDSNDLGVSSVNAAAIEDTGDATKNESLPPLDPRSTRLFQPKSWSDPQNAQMGRLILKFLCGQTTKATQDISYVAFVHRQSQCISGEFDVSHNPLKICEQLLRTFVGDSTSTVAMHITLWDKVHEEQEKIYKEATAMGKWELLSAAQAIMLYILLWLRMEGEHEKFPHDNIALLFTLGKLFDCLGEKYLHMDASGTIVRPIHNWHEWIFQESCLRVATVYFILSVIITMDIGFDCDGPSDWSIEKMPLPASKALWEAENETVWRNIIGQSSDFANKPTFGDLFRNKDLQAQVGGKWEEELDEIGLIVAMVGRLSQKMDSNT